MKNELNFSFALENPSLYKSAQCLDQDSKKKLLLLDLDETLIHSDFNDEFLNHKTIKYDTIIEFEDKDEEIDTENENEEEDFFKGTNMTENKDESNEEDSSYKTDDEMRPMCTVGIFVRNGVKEFLTEASKHFDIGVFTASVKEYADAIVDYLDPEKKFIKYRFYRNNCINVGGMINVKDLRVIKGVDLANTVLVDNSIYSFAPQLTNGILINSFFNDKNDGELFNVLGYLINYILPAKDVRDVNEQFFNFQTLVNEVN